MTAHVPKAVPRRDRSGMLIVRLWIESSALEGLRARITQTLDSAGPEQAVATVATAEEICEVVKAWVDAFVNEN
jgi:hypothetical protein